MTPFLKMQEQKSNCKRKEQLPFAYFAGRKERDRWLMYKYPISQPTAMQTEAREKALERIPLKRFGTVEEIADAAVFLATNQYANNCVINLDGGLSAVSARSRHNPFFSPVSCYSKTPYARVV